MQNTTTHHNTPQRTAQYNNTLQVIIILVTVAVSALYNAAHRDTLQRTATHCSTPQHTTIHYNSLQYTAAHRNTLHITTFVTASTPSYLPTLINLSRSRFTKETYQVWLSLLVIHRIYVATPTPPRLSTLTKESTGQLFESIQM